MKLWKLQILWGEEKHRTVLRFDRNLSRLDVERIQRYISGYYHFVRKSKGIKPKVPPLTAEVLLQNTDPPKINEREPTESEKEELRT